MRIINGSLKGRRLMAPKNLPTRPTTDMAKEGLFNMLNNDYYFEELTVLDIFSGTGNISFEFCSRGCTRIDSVDLNVHCTRYIQKTTEELNLNGISVTKSDAIAFLKRTAKNFDIVFADPPYEFEGYAEIIEQVFERNLLLEDGVLILEHDKSNDFSKHANFVKHKRYGHVNFSFFKA